MKFGSFQSVCENAALPLCPVIGPNGEGVEPTCYSRNVEIASTLIFQPATLIIHFITLVMTVIMIYHIRSKFTAVGRKEMVTFFYLYFCLVLLEAFLISGIIPTASPIYGYFAAAQVSLLSATVWCLLVNGFVGFQFAEDGTPLSLWSLRVSTVAVFGVVYFIAISTFKGVLSFNPETPTALYIVYFVFNGASLLVYVILQIVLVINTLDDRWPLGDILFGVVFFVIAQVIVYFFCARICEYAKHYIDGMFFSAIAMLLAVMMVYKYWDSITKEDLEFSVGGKQNLWEVKELPGDDEYMSNSAYAYSAPSQYSYNAHSPYGYPE